MKSYINILFLVLGSIFLNAQTVNDTLYLEYEENFRIIENTDTLNNIRIDVSFAVFGKNDNKVTTYNYWIDNISREFEYLKFKDIKDILSFEEHKKIKTKTLKDLSKLTSCDLLFLLADTKHIYLIKKEDESYYRYRLVYSNTQRGIAYVRTD